MNAILHNSYRADVQAGVWVHHDKADAFPCRDNAFAQTLLAVGDVSCGSEDLRQHIHSWPTRLAFDPRRADLLRPLRHFLRGSVLELGAGNGAVTRYLGETAQTVVAVERDPPQAVTTQLRCRDLSTVTVVCDDLHRFTSPHLFDAVTLIGVLDDENNFLGSEDRLVTALSYARRFLKDDGVAIVAVTNHFGLNYFAGAREEANILACSGINQAQNTAQSTYRDEAQLRAALKRCDLTDTMFLYPLPDYRLPSLIVTELGGRDGSVFTANLLACAAAGDQTRPYTRMFSEEVAWPEALRGGMLPLLSNAFLVATRKTKRRGPPLACVDTQALAYLYATVRPRAFAKETVATDDATSGIQLQRRHIYSDLEREKNGLRQTLVNEKALTGPLYTRRLTRLLNTPSWSAGQIAEWADPWIRLLRASAKAPDSQSAVDPDLPGSMVDCVPFNLIEAPDGLLIPFDLEWELARAVPLSYVSLRGLLFSLIRHQSVASPAARETTHVISLAVKVCALLGLPISRICLDNAFELEATWFGSTKAQLEDAHLRVRPLDIQDKLQSLQRQNQHLTAAIAQCDKEIKALRADNSQLRTELVKNCRGVGNALPSTFSLDKETALAVRLISPVFDVPYYQSQHSEDVPALEDPVAHYIRRGARAGLNPNLWFDTNFYLQSNPDVARSGINPLVHYVAHGWREGRSTCSPPAPGTSNP